MSDLSEPMTRPQARALAVQLLDAHVGLIADTVVELSARIRPELRVLDAEARRRGTERMVRTLSEVVKGADAEALLALIEEVLTLRAMAGIEPQNFVSVAFCYPVAIRRVFQLKADVRERGEQAFDEIEVVLLPVLSRFGDVLFSVHTDDEMTDPGSPWFQSLVRSTQDESAQG